MSVEVGETIESFKEGTGECVLLFKGNELVLSIYT